MPMERPIPAFYCCYLLRSTKRRSSVYVGSTPNPVRRLGQHNGVKKGGAVRTSRDSLRPWEMTCTVSGFTSHIAALQFEWAWQNPHVTLHIPHELRIQHTTSKKRSGQPKRPRHTIASLLSNLHLLLRVPSFSRWPLELRFFSEDAYREWLEWCKVAPEPIRESIQVIQDFSPQGIKILDKEGHLKLKTPEPLGGIEAIDIGYTSAKGYIEKAKNIVDFEQEGICSLCNSELEHAEGIYAICPNTRCRAVTHVTCLGQHFLDEDDESLVPIRGACPSCNTESRWLDIAKELSLRLRGEKEVEKILKVKKIGPRKVTSSSQITVESDIEIDEREEEEEGEEGFMEPTPTTARKHDEGWYKAKSNERLGSSIQDSDWEDAEVIE